MTSGIKEGQCIIEYSEGKALVAIVTRWSFPPYENNPKDGLLTAGELLQVSESSDKLKKHASNEEVLILSVAIERCDDGHPFVPILQHLSSRLRSYEEARCYLVDGEEPSLLFSVMG